MNVSGTGPIKLAGSADAPLQNLKIFGKSVQNGTPSPDNPIAIENIGKVVTGKNLLDPELKEEAFDRGRIRWGYANGIVLNKGQTYTFSVNYESGYTPGGLYVYYQESDEGAFSMFATKVLTFTPTETTKYFLMIYADENGSAPLPQDEDPRAQLELGSTATAYEPYKVLDRTIGVMVSGKNLVNIPLPITLDGNPMTYSIDLDLEGTFTFSYTFTGEATAVQTSALFSFVVDGSTQYCTMTTPTKTLTGHLTNITILNWSQIVGTIYTIQLELGSTATDYVPYQPPQTLDISIPVYRKNLCSTTDLTFETSEQIKFAENIPAGDYILSASIESTDTDSTANLALFYYTDGSTKEVYLTRSSTGARVSKTFTLSKEASRVRLYASEGHSLSSGDTSTWSDIQIEAGSTMSPFEPYFEPYGLPGIPVASGGNYTDSDGQQWWADEINFAKGKYIQRIGRIVLSNDANLQESPYIYGGDTIGAVWHNLIPEDYDAPVGLCEYAPVGDYMPGDIDTSFIWVGSVGLDLVFWIDVIRYLGFTTVDEFKTWLGDKKIPVLYKLNTPIEHELPSDLMEAWNPIKTYYPDTILDNDAGAWMWAQYLSNDDIPDDNPYFDPRTEIGKYYKALARYSTEMPNPTCRESQLIRAILDPDYTLPFTVDETYSRAERYLWDILHNTQEMITNIPKSAKEKFLHMMIGGEVTEYPTVDNEVLFWMQRCVEMQMNINALMHGGRI